MLDRCEGCRWLMPLYHSGWGRRKNMACHYYLMNGKRRERDGDICLSYELGEAKYVPEMELPDIPVVSIYCGYKNSKYRREDQ